MLIAKPGGKCPRCNKKIKKIEFAYPTNKGQIIKRAEKNGCYNGDCPNKEITFLCPDHGYFTRQYNASSIRTSYRKREGNEYWHFRSGIVGRLVEGAWLRCDAHCLLRVDAV